MPTPGIVPSFDRSSRNSSRQSPGRPERKTGSLDRKSEPAQARHRKPRRPPGLPESERASRPPHERQTRFTSPRKSGERENDYSDIQFHRDVLRLHARLRQSLDEPFAHLADTAVVVDPHGEKIAPAFVALAPHRHAAGNGHRR